MRLMFRSYQGLGALLLLGASMLVSAGPANARSNNAVEWEIRTTVVVPGVPPSAVPPTVTRQCLEENAIPYQSKGDEKCETVYKNESGNTISWNIICTNGGSKMEMTGVSSYTGNTMESNVQMKSQNGDREASIHMTGKKLGLCK